MKNKAFFWDRDGILNYLVKVRSDGKKYVSPQKYEDFVLVPEAAYVLGEIKKRGYLNIVATNQPDISRGLMPQSELLKMHKVLRKTLPLSALYVCPHDDIDMCICRKPKPGMLLKAAEEYDLDLPGCYIVGDSHKDIKAGEVIGVKTIYLHLPHKEVLHATYTVKNLGEILTIF